MHPKVESVDPSAPQAYPHREVLAMTPPPRVYLDGPDVFHPDRDRLFRGRAQLCRAYGLELLIPSYALLASLSRRASHESR
jgi:nucleoside 2-deoxyribosyltransferase